MTEPSTSRRASFFARWWIYQRERFPVFGHGPVVLAFSASAVCFSSMLRQGGEEPAHWPRPAAIAVAFVCCLLMFLQLRIADEFKDYDEDLRFRPYRPVQRGLVTRRELGVLFALCAVVQAILAWCLSPRLLILLLIAWAYLTLMSKEFFVRDWLKRHPLLYLWSHMCIMPLIDLLATGCDWIPSPAGAPGSARALALFLCASYFNGVVIEIGRKIRSPADEEPGVQTYSSLWGPRRAVVAWLGAMAVCGVLASVAAWWIGAVPLVGAVAGGYWLAAAWLGVRFLRKQASGGGKVIERASGLWTILLYLAIGLVPLALRTLTG